MRGYNSSSIKIVLFGVECEKCEFLLKFERKRELFDWIFLINLNLNTMFIYRLYKIKETRVFSNITFVIIYKIYLIYSAGYNSC